MGRLLEVKLQKLTTPSTTAVFRFSPNLECVPRGFLTVRIAANEENKKHAWFPTAWTPDEIRTPTPENRCVLCLCLFPDDDVTMMMRNNTVERGFCCVSWVGTPYTKRHCSFLHVDQVCRTRSLFCLSEEGYIRVLSLSLSFVGRHRYYYVSR